MSEYIGLDVSLEDTHLCAVDGLGAVTARAVVRTDPDDLAKAIRDLAPDVKTVVLETGGPAS